MKDARPGLSIFLALAALLCGVGTSLLGICGPFTDVTDPAFCPFVLEIFTLGITTGTTPTTYDPAGNVTRVQMAAFLSRTVDGVLKRGSRRAAFGQFWTTQGAQGLALTTVGFGASPQRVQSDGADLWVSILSSGSVARVRASDGKLLETWTGAIEAEGVLVAMGHIFVTGDSTPSSLYRIDPSQPAGVVTTVASNLGNWATGIAFDGSRIWTANVGGSVSIVTPGALLPWTVTTVTTGFSGSVGAIYDGANIWVTDSLGLLRLDTAASVLQTITIGSGQFPTFDGTNIWVPASNVVFVVRASSGVLLATLTGNGLNGPVSAAFDGQRVLVTNPNGQSVSLWKAADLTSLGSFATGASTFPTAACSDGINFWIILNFTGQLARF